jgi:hypothetical protein
MSNTHGPSKGNHHAELDEPAIGSHSPRRQALTRVHRPKGTKYANPALIAGYRVPTGWRAGGDGVRASSFADAW